jgi:hypothetical protein
MLPVNYFYRFRPDERGTFSCLPWNKAACFPERVDFIVRFRPLGRGTFCEDFRLDYALRAIQRMS